MVDGAWQEAEKNIAAGPADRAAKEIAVGFLKDKGLLPDEYTGPYVADMGAVSPGAAGPDGAESALEEPPKVAQPPYLEVRFGKKLGAYDLVEPSGEASRYIASVTVGPGGAIMAASGEIPGSLEASAYPLIGVEEAFNAVKRGGRSPDRTGVAPVKVELSQVELAYRMVVGSDGVGYYEPAYLFSGKSGPPASASAYSVAVPAVARAHIKRP
jgi:hypothetical protein